MFHYFKYFVKNHLHLEVHSTYQMTNLLKECTAAEDSCRNFNTCVHLFKRVQEAFWNLLAGKWVDDA
jgi:hypothetical protein